MPAIIQPGQVYFPSSGARPPWPIAVSGSGGGSSTSSGPASTGGSTGAPSGTPASGPSLSAPLPVGLPGGSPIAHVPVPPPSGGSQTCEEPANSYTDYRRLLGTLWSQFPGAISAADWSLYFVAGTAFDNNVNAALANGTYSTIWLVNDYPSLRLIEVDGASGASGSNGRTMLWISASSSPPGPLLAPGLGAVITGTPAGTVGGVPSIRPRSV